MLVTLFVASLTTFSVSAQSPAVRIGSAAPGFALTAVFAKIGVEGIPSNLATAIRTVVRQ